VLDDDRWKAMPTIGDDSHTRSLGRSRSDPVGGFPDNAFQTDVGPRAATDNAHRLRLHAAIIYHKCIGFPKLAVTLLSPK
jgi:hypothetical protein